MLFYNRISQQFVWRVQPLAKVHFVVQFVQTAVAVSANRNRILQLVFSEMFFKMLSAMQLARNKMVSSQLRRPLA